MSRQQIFTACFFAALLLLLYQVVLIFRPFLFPVLWAVVLAHLSFPLHVRCSEMLRGKESLSATLLTLSVMLLVVGPLASLGVMLVKEAATGEQTVRAWIAAGGVQRLPQELSGMPLVGRLIQEVMGLLVIKPGGIEQFFLSSAKVLSEFIVSELSDLVRNVFLLVADFIVMMFTLFFLFKDGRRWLTALYELTPLEDSHKARIFVRLDQTIRAVVKGVVLTAIVQGILAGAAYLVLGVPFPVVLTAVTVLLAPLPFGGTALVWVPVTLYLFVSGSMGKGLVMLAWGAGVVSTVDQILKPLFIGQGAQIPVLLLTFSMLGGLALYGIIGLFLGPILIGLLLTAMQIYRDEYHSPPVGSPAPIPKSDTTLV